MKFIELMPDEKIPFPDVSPLGAGIWWVIIDDDAAETGAPSRFAAQGEYEDVCEAYENAGGTISTIVRVTIEIEDN